jgi:hypothetical protein
VPQAGFASHDQGSRGAVALPLLLNDPHELSRLTARVALPPDARVLDIRMDNVPMYDNVTTNYWCMWVEVLTDAKYHIYDVQVRVFRRIDHLVMQ